MRGDPAACGVLTMSPRQAVPASLQVRKQEAQRRMLPSAPTMNFTPLPGTPLPCWWAQLALPTRSCPGLSTSAHQGTLSVFQADQIVFVDSGRSTVFKLTFGQQNPMRLLHFSKSAAQIWVHTPEGGTWSAL